MKIALIVVGLTLSVPGQAIDYVCPASLPLLEAGKTGVWLSYADPERSNKAGITPAFERAEVRDGEITDLGTLIPDNDEQEGRYWEWRLHWSQDKSYQNFAACSYNGTNVVLFQALPRDLSHCRVTRGSGNKVRAVSCR